MPSGQITATGRNEDEDLRYAKSLPAGIVIAGQYQFVSFYFNIYGDLVNLRLYVEYVFQ